MDIAELIFTVVAFVAVLVVLVIAHEIGHFFTAKASASRWRSSGSVFPRVWFQQCGTAPATR